MKTELLDSSPHSIGRACSILESQKIVALPTETVYGLAGNAFDEASVREIFSAKSRPYFDPLIVHISLKVLSDPAGVLHALIRDGILAPSLAASSDRSNFEALVKEFWPGPLTLVVPRGPLIPDVVTGGHPTVAIRMPSHEVFQSILGLLPFPLAAPSANRFGRISPTTAEHVRAELDGRIAAIVDGGPCGIGVESTIIRLEEGGIRLLRPGGVSSAEIASITGSVPRTQQKLHSSAPEAPGMLDEHYAPRKPLFLIPEPIDSHPDLRELLRELGDSSRLGLLLHAPVRSSFDVSSFKSHRILSGSGDGAEAARNLFSFMRELDEDPFVDVILADLPENHFEGMFAAIADRLQRASRNKPLGQSVKKL